MSHQTAEYQLNVERSSYTKGDDPQLLINDNAKRSISLRVNTTDYGKIRIIARRLRTRESDVFRFLLKMALAQLTPLHTEQARGREMMPLLVEFGAEIARHFGLDARRLEMMVNAGESDPGNRVDPQDLELLTMTGIPDRALFHRLQDMMKMKLDPFSLGENMRQYLRDKYAPQHRGEPGHTRK